VPERALQASAAHARPRRYGPRAAAARRGASRYVPRAKFTHDRRNGAPFSVVGRRIRGAASALRRLP